MIEMKTTPKTEQQPVAQGERETFEGLLNVHSRRRNEHGDYVLPSIQDRWSGWQARATIAQDEQQPEQSGLVEAAVAVIRAADWWSENEDSPKSALAHFVRAANALRDALEQAAQRV